MGNADNITVVQMNLTQIVKKCYNDIEGIYNKYGSKLGDIPMLPEYDKIVRSPKVYYTTYAEYMAIGDEVMQAMLSLNLVFTNLHDIKATTLNRSMTNDFTILQGFKKFLEDNLERLTRHRYDLIELRRQVTDRIKLLQALNFLNT